MPAPDYTYWALEAYRQRASGVDTSKPPKESTYDFMARVSPQLPRSTHLQPLADILDRSPLEGYTEVFSVPPRHGKTTTIEHAIVRMLENDPSLKIAYVTYAEDLSLGKSRNMRNLVAQSVFKWEEMGKKPPLEIERGSAAIHQWRTTAGGMLHATGIGGPLTGNGYNLVVIDDAFKGHEEANSTRLRKKTLDWFDTVAYTRQDGRGTSFLCNGTRWHAEDLIGQLIQRGWRFNNLKAIDDERGALWPEVWGMDRLLKIKANNEFEFSALYQGEPRSKEDAVFRGVPYYDSLPVGPYTTSVGLDFAYSGKTTADYSVAVVLRIYADGNAYVVDVLRFRGEAPAFKKDLMALLIKHAVLSGGRKVLPKCRAFIAGTELAVLQFMASATDSIGSIPIERMPAVGDKLARAQDCAAAWNRKAIAVPAKDETAAWLPAFESELAMFTGIGDKHDDQVDALAGAYVPAVRGPQAQRRFGVPSGFVL